MLNKINGNATINIDQIRAFLEESGMLNNENIYINKRYDDEQELYFMTKSGLLNYGSNLGEANENEEEKAPFRCCKTVEEAVANVVWMGEEIYLL